MQNRDEKISLSNLIRDINKSSSRMLCYLTVGLRQWTWDIGIGEPMQQGVTPIPHQE